MNKQCLGVVRWSKTGYSVLYVSQFSSYPCGCAVFPKGVCNLEFRPTTAVILVTRITAVIQVMYTM